MEAKDIHKGILPMYGKHCLYRQAVHNWVHKFSEGRTIIEDEHWSGRPVAIATPETLQGVEDIIRAEKKVTVDSVATAIDCSHSQAYNMMQFLPSRRWCGWKSSARVVPTATKRILRRRFPGTCETVGDVFKFVWRLCWKISVVCMSLSPFYSFQSRFVTY